MDKRIMNLIKKTCNESLSFAEIHITDYGNTIIIKYNTRPDNFDPTKPDPTYIEFKVNKYECVIEVEINSIFMLPNLDNKYIFSEKDSEYSEIQTIYKEIQLLALKANFIS